MPPSGFFRQCFQEVFGLYVTIGIGNKAEFIGTPTEYEGQEFCQFVDLLTVFHRLDGCGVKTMVNVNLIEILTIVSSVGNLYKVAWWVKTGQPTIDLAASVW
jgi:hypothetical protein